MGWNSAGDIFDPVARALIELGAPDAMKTRVLGDLIGALQDGDWDTEDESLEQFKNDPAIVAAFADHDVYPDDEDDVGDQGDADSDVFALIAEIASRLTDATDEGEYHAAGLIGDLANGRKTITEARSELADITFRHV
jgi:hypothetical protein